MPDPLAEAGPHGPVPYIIAFAISAATSIAGAVGGALRFSGRIADAENEAKAAIARAAEAEKACGKLADELKLVRLERPTAPVNEAEIQRRIAEAVRAATEPIKDDTDRLEDEVQRLRTAAERGVESHALVREALARIQGALDREARR